MILGYDPAQHRNYAGVVICEVVPWKDPRTGQYPKDRFGYHFAQLNVRWLDRWRGFDYEEQVPKLLKLIGCDRAGARDYAAFLGFFFLEPS